MGLFKSLFTPLLFVMRLLGFCDLGSEIQNLVDLLAHTPDLVHTPDLAHTPDLVFQLSLLLALSVFVTKDRFIVSVALRRRVQVSVDLDLVFKPLVDHEAVDFLSVFRESQHG